MAPYLERQFLVERGYHGAMHERSLAAENAAGTILYVHGLGESALCFERLMADERLAHWRHLAVDLVGYGKSTWADEPLSVDQHAEQLDRLTDDRALGDVVVLGHSMGGVIGARLCERLGDVDRSPASGGTLRAFINVEGNVSLPDCGYSSRAVKFSLDEWLAGGFDQVLDAIYHHQGESAEVRRAYGASIQMCDPRAYHRNSEELVETSSAETMAQRLAALGTTVAYVHGSPRGTCDRSLELLEQAGIERIRIDGAGHWPFLDQHDAFVEAMAGFLDRPRPAD